MGKTPISAAEAVQLFAEKVTEMQGVLECAMADDGHTHKCSRDPCSPWCDTVRDVLGMKEDTPEPTDG